jgi:hypothetical protein
VFEHWGRAWMSLDQFEKGRRPEKGDLLHFITDFWHFSSELGVWRSAKDAIWLHD